MKVVDSKGVPVPLWLVRMLCDGDAVREDVWDTFWRERRDDYRIVSC